MCFNTIQLGCFWHLQMTKQQHVAGRLGQRSLRTLTSQKTRLITAARGNQRRWPSVPRDGVGRNQENVTRKNHSLHLRSYCSTAADVPEKEVDRLLLLLVLAEGLYFSETEDLLHLVVRLCVCVCVCVPHKFIVSIFFWWLMHFTVSLSFFVSWNMTPINIRSDQMFVHCPFLCVWFFHVAWNASVD